MPIKIILFGKNGQVGWELQRTLAPLGEVLALDYQELDLTNTSALQKYLLTEKPSVIVNAAAYTAVDRAEREPQVAHAVNATAPGVMADAARQVGAGFIHFSTDYVFDGVATKPYVETDTPRPINQYGLSKLAGEEVVQQAGDAYLILRTSWVYSLRGDSFVNKVLAWSRKNHTLRIVADQTGSPTWARLLAETVAILLARGELDPVGYLKDVQGLYHLAGAGQTTRYAWAQEILKLDPMIDEQITNCIEPVHSDEFPTAATRPEFSALECSLFSKTFDLRLPAWEENLAQAMAEAEKK